MSRLKELGNYGVPSYTFIALNLDLILPLTAMSEDLHPSALVYANLRDPESTHFLLFHLQCMSEASYTHGCIVKSKPWTGNHDALHLHDRCVHSCGHPSSLV